MLLLLLGALSHARAAAARSPPLLVVDFDTEANFNISMDGALWLTNAKIETSDQVCANTLLVFLPGVVVNLLQ